MFADSSYTTQVTLGVMSDCYTDPLNTFCYREIFFWSWVITTLCHCTPQSAARFHWLCLLLFCSLKTQIFLLQMRRTAVSKINTKVLFSALTSMCTTAFSNPTLSVSSQSTTQIVFWERQGLTAKFIHVWYSALLTYDEILKESFAHAKLLR